MKRESTWILSGNLGRYSTGNPPEILRWYFEEMLMIFSGYMQMNFSGESAEICDNNGNFSRDKLRILRENSSAQRFPFDSFGKF